MSILNANEIIYEMDDLGMKSPMSPRAKELEQNKLSDNLYYVLSNRTKLGRLTYQKWRTTYYVFFALDIKRGRLLTFKHETSKSPKAY